VTYFPPIVSGPPVGSRWNLAGNNYVGLHELARVQVRDEEAGPWTVTLCPMPPYDTDGRLQDRRMLGAVIEWGIGELTCQAEVDWAQGNALTVVGSVVKVYVDKATIPQPAGASHDLREIAAFIAPGPKAQQALPTKTIYYGSLGELVSVPRRIPAFAKRAKVWCTGVSAPVDCILQWRRPGALSVKYQVIAASNLRDRYDIVEWNEVPCNAVELDLRNSTSVTMDWYATYQLAL